MPSIFLPKFSWFKAPTVTLLSLLMLLEACRSEKDRPHALRVACFPSLLLRCFGCGTNLARGNKVKCELLQRRKSCAISLLSYWPGRSDICMHVDTLLQRFDVWQRYQSRGTHRGWSYLSQRAIHETWNRSPFTSSTQVI